MRDIPQGDNFAPDGEGCGPAFANVFSTAGWLQAPGHSNRLEGQQEVYYILGGEGGSPPVVIRRSCTRMLPSSGPPDWKNCDEVNGDEL